MALAPSAIRLDFIPTTASARTLVLTGTNDTTIASITVTGADSSVVQPNSTTWRAELRLAAGTNTIKINGLDIAGNTTQTISFSVELASLTDDEHQVFNVFDEFGLLLALPRLPGEKNLPYKNRLLDVNVHPSDTRVVGVTYGASRDIGVQVADYLTIASPLDATVDGPRAVNGRVRVGPVYLDLETTEFHTQECHKIEPATQQITLDRWPSRDADLEITTIEGDLIPRTDWTLDRHRKTVTFSTHIYNGLLVNASYFYQERILIRGRTLRQLEADVEAFTNSAGDTLYEVELLRNPDEPADDLIPLPIPVGISNDPLTFEGCPVRVRELLDYDYQQANLNAQGTAIRTKMAQWAQAINNQTRIIWDATYLGESVWSPLGEEPKLGALPHPTDAARGHWECQDPTDDTRFTLKDYRATGGTCPTDGTPLEYIGILPLQFQSGTGTGDDLKVRDIVVIRGD